MPKLISPSSVLEALRGYHASPHKFDKFDTAHIGSGEGNQSYGDGLYFADAPKVMDNYYKSFSRNKLPLLVSPDGLHHYGPMSSEMPTWVNLLHEHEGNLDAALRSAQETVDSTRNGGLLAQRVFDKYSAALKDLQEFGPKSDYKAPAYRYEVNLHVDPKKMIDWDKPARNQMDLVDRLHDRVGRNRVKQLGQEWEDLHQRLDKQKYDKASPDWARYEEMLAVGPERGAVKMHTLLQDLGKEFANPEKYPEGRQITRRGSDIWNVASQLGNRGEGRKALLDIEVPGIRYLDGMSRFNGDGTRNTVMFDHTPIEILRRWKQGGAVAGLPRM